jgi:hypothetical protein
MPVHTSVPSNMQHEMGEDVRRLCRAVAFLYRTKKMQLSLTKKKKGADYARNNCELYCVAFRVGYVPQNITQSSKYYYRGSIQKVYVKIYVICYSLNCPNFFHL